MAIVKCGEEFSDANSRFSDESNTGRIDFSGDYRSRPRRADGRPDSDSYGLHIRNDGTGFAEDRSTFTIDLSGLSETSVTALVRGINKFIEGAKKHQQEITAVKTKEEKIDELIDLWWYEIIELEQDRILKEDK